MMNDEKLEVLWVHRGFEWVMSGAEVLTLSTNVLAGESTVAHLATLTKHAIVQKLGPHALEDDDLIIHDFTLNGVALATLPPATAVASLLPQLRFGHPRFVVASRLVAISGDMPLTVKTPDKMEHRMRVHADQTVNLLRGDVYEWFHYPEEHLRLIFNGKRLDDNDRTLRDYGISADSTVFVTAAAAGGSTMRSFMDVSKGDAILDVQPFNPSAPKWRVCARGLNVEGICRNPSCEANGQYVIAMLHERPFNLYEAAIDCAICHQIVVPATCAFYDCDWKFEGIKDRLAYSSGWQRVVAGKYNRFQPAAHDIVQWTSLLITVKKWVDAGMAKAIRRTEAAMATCAFCNGPIAAEDGDVVPPSGRRRGAAIGGVQLLPPVPWRLLQCVDQALPCNWPPQHVSSVLHDCLSLFCF